MQEGVVFVHRAQQEKAPVGLGLGGVEHRGQVQPRPNGAGPAQNGGRHPRHGVETGDIRVEEGQVDPVGQQGDVGAARRQPVSQQGGRGKDYVRRLGQAALPVGGRTVPHPVAVVDQGAVLQLVHQVDVVGLGGPQQGLGEAPAGGLLLNEAADLVPGHLEQALVPLGDGEEDGRQGAGRHVGPDLAPSLPIGLVPGGAGGGEVEYLAVPQAGDDLLGAAGKPAGPGLIG